MKPSKSTPTTDANGGKELLSLADLTKIAGVSRRFLEAEINRGRLRKIQMSARVVRIRRTDWEKYLEKIAV